MDPTTSKDTKKRIFAPKTVLTLKICLLFLIGTVTQAFSSVSYSQSAALSLKLNNVAIEEVLNQIESQTEFRFLYNKNLVNVNKKVSVNASNQRVTSVLDEIFKGENVEYAINDRQIVLSKKSEEGLSSTQQSKVVKGIVTDKKTGEALTGVSVSVKGSTIGTATNIDGGFSLTAPSDQAVLVFSYLGYTSSEVKVGNQTDITVQLGEDSKLLDEVVVVGYGVQKKSNLTGTVGVVKAEALASRPVASISAALAGQIPGVTTIQNSGQPGSQTGSITVRGKNTINAASPLVIVDGVPGSLNDIPLGDVASISVLKDAASSAIYGVQAANGVILVTTKRGNKSEKTRVNYSGTVSWTDLTTHLKILGSGDYAMLYNEATLNDNPKAPLKWTDEDIQKFRDGSDPEGHPNTDWYKETFKSHAWEQMQYLSLNGGTEKTNYNASLQYTNQEGLLDQTNYERFNARMNLDSQISSWFSAGMNLSGYRGISNDGWDTYSAIMGSINRSSPTEPVYKDGDYNYFGSNNPVAQVGNTGFRKTTNQQVLGTVYGTINFLPNLSLKGLFSVRNDTKNDQAFKKHYSYGNFDSGLREGFDNYYDYNRYTAQALANYNETWGKHSLAALAGYEQYEYKYKYTKAGRKGGGNDELQESLNTLDASSQTNEDGGNELARQSVFGRLQYNFDSKYLFEANARYDGSSVFPKGKQFGFFPSLSAGWILSRESFLEDATWLSNLKIRAGWGKTGNEELGADDLYPAVATYAYDKYMFGNTLYSTAKEARYVNNQLSWAKVTNYELGLDFSALNNLIGFELAVYKKETQGMILYLPVLDVLGMPAPAQNAGNVENKGFDLNIFHNKVINKDWKYNVYGNVAYVQNKITNMAGTEGPNKDNNKIWYLEGYPIGSFYGYKANGFFNTNEELASYPKRTGQEKLGDIKYVDMGDKDGKITAANDRTVIGHNFPAWTMGLGAGIDYKNFNFYFFFQGAFDVDMYTEAESAYAFFNGGVVLNRHLDRWTPDHHDATYPRITKSTQTNYQTSSFWLQDASYVRLKNISLGYTLPKSLLEKVKLENVKVFLSGENLLTVCGIEGIDPEAPSSNRGSFYPVTKKVALGLNITF